MKTRAIFMLTLFTAASLPLALVAQTTETQLDEVRVTGAAGGTGTAPAGTASTTVVTAAEIERKQASTLGDVLRDAPGVMTARRGDVVSAMPNIRGFGGNPHMAADPATQVSLDGVSVGGGRTYQVASDMAIDPSLLRSARVLAGPLASLAYGSGISGGTVVLETINGADLTGDQLGFRFRQLLSANSNGKGWATSSTLAWQPSKGADFLFNYSRRAQDEQEDGNGALTRRKGFNVPSYLAKARFRINDENTLTLSFNRSSAAQRDVPLGQASAGAGFGNADRDRVGDVYSAAWNYNPAGNDLIDLELRFSRSDQVIDQRGLCAPQGPYACTPGVQAINFSYDGRTTSVTDRVTLKNTARFATGAITHELQAGLDFSRQNQTSDNTVQPVSGKLNRQAIFAVNNMDFGNDLRASVGLRVERQSIRGVMLTVPAGSPPGTPASVPTNIGPFDTTARTLGVGLEKGFGNLTAFGAFTYGEMPSNLDVFHQPWPVAFGGGLMGQNIQQSRNWELGLRYRSSNVFQSGDSLSAGITAYRTDVWNAMYGPNTGGNTIGTGYRMRGVDLTVRYDNASGFYGNAGLSYAHHSQMGSTTLHIGPYSWIDYNYNPGLRGNITVGKRWESGWDVSWTLEAARNNTINSYGSATAVAAGTALPVTPVRHPGWGVNDLNIGYTPQSGVLAGATVNFAVENILGKTYRNQPLSSLNEAGRNFKLTLSKTF